LYEYKEIYKYIFLETDDNPDLKSPTTPGMSLETFIARDFSVMEHQIQPVITEQNEDNDDEQLQTTEKITTEDILGNISESDTSDDENDKKQSPSSSLPTSQIQQDVLNDSNLQTNESLLKPHHHKHSKKRLKTSHSHSTSSDAAALQLSEDEL